MKDFDYIREANTFYQPRTPMAAIKAVEMGVIPPEGFIYKACSVKPLYEEPIDLDEIERVLARVDLDLETILLLIKILNKLLTNPDPEIALFGAESINAIENRYNNRITELRDALKEKINDPELSISLAEQYFELSQINDERLSIKKFYLKEAHSALHSILEEIEISEMILDLYTNILLELNVYNQARDFLKKIFMQNPILKIKILFYLAEADFREGRFRGVIKIFSTIKEKKLPLNTAQKDLIEYWTGE